MRKFSQAGLAFLTGFFATSVLAAPPDFTTLTAAVDYSTATAAILLVMAALAAVAIVWKGGKLILRALGIS